MVSCFALFKPCTNSYATTAAAAKHSKSVQVVKIDGKIIEFSRPILVKDLLVKFPGLGIGLSKKSSQNLPPDYELKLGNIYYLLPSSTNVPNFSPAAEETVGVKRIKVVITKKQLKELLSKQVLVADVISGIDQRKTCYSVKPKLESVPEGNEL